MQRLRSCNLIATILCSARIDTGMSAEIAWRRIEVPKWSCKVPGIWLLAAREMVKNSASRLVRRRVPGVLKMEHSFLNSFINRLKIYRFRTLLGKAGKMAVNRFESSLGGSMRLAQHF